MRSLSLGLTVRVSTAQRHSNTHTHGSRLSNSITQPPLYCSSFNKSPTRGEIQYIHCQNSHVPFIYRVTYLLLKSANTIVCFKDTILCNSDVAVTAESYPPPPPPTMTTGCALPYYINISILTPHNLICFHF